MQMQALAPCCGGHFCSPRPTLRAPRHHRQLRVHAATAANGDQAAAAALLRRRQQLLALAGALAAAAGTQLQLPAAALAEEGAASSSAPRAFFDLSVDREPLGRVVIELFPDVTVGAQRFLDLSQGKEGVAYRRTRFELLEDNFIQDSGLKALSFRADGRTSIAGGGDTEALEGELAAQQAAAGRSHAAAGVVSLLVQPRITIVTKDKLVAVKGQLVNVQEQFGEIPNGTAWAITTAPAPQLDATNLVVGRVVEGMDVVVAVAALPRVKNNKDSPFFKAGKVAGDKRADVAERAFNKAYAKILIEECGLL